MEIICYDASVVIGLMDADDAHHVAAVKDFRERRRRRDVQIVLPASAYAEVLVRPQRAGDDAFEVVRSFCQEHVRVAALDPAMAEAAAGHRARHGSLRLPDALVLGTASVLGAAAVVTADERWSRYADNIVVLAPQPAS